jgi:hypothetical protein
LCMQGVFVPLGVFTGVLLALLLKPSTDSL